MSLQGHRPIFERRLAMSIDVEQRLATAVNAYRRLATDTGRQKQCKHDFYPRKGGPWEFLPAREPGRWISAGWAEPARERETRPWSMPGQVCG